MGKRQISPPRILEWERLLLSSAPHRIHPFSSVSLFSFFKNYIYGAFLLAAGVLVGVAATDWLCVRIHRGASWASVFPAPSCAPAPGTAQGLWAPRIRRFLPHASPCLSHLSALSHAFYLFPEFAEISCLLATSPILAFWLSWVYLFVLTTWAVISVQSRKENDANWCTQLRLESEFFSL